MYSARAISGPEATAALALMETADKTANDDGTDARHIDGQKVGAMISAVELQEHALASERTASPEELACDADAVANAAHEDASSQPSDTNSTAPLETAAEITAIGAMYFVEIVYAIGLLALAVRMWGSLTKHEATVVCAYLLMSPVILEFVAQIAPGNVSNFQGVHDETMTAVVGKIVVPAASYTSLVYGLPELKPKLSERMTLPVKLGVFAGILGTASAQGTWVTSRVEA